MNEQADILQATHKLALVDDCFVALCSLDEEIIRIVSDPSEVPTDLADRWFHDGKVFFVALSNDYSDEHEILYYGEPYELFGYKYAYSAEL